MSVVKRILVFIGALIVLQLGASMVGGGISGGMAAAHAPNQAAVPHLAIQAGAEFAIRYRPVIFASALILSAMLAFGSRLVTLLFAAPFAVLAFLGLQQNVGDQEARLKAALTQFAGVAATATPEPARGPKSATLLSPVTVRVAYGQATLPRGTVVTVLSQKGDSAEVKAPGGATFSVPLTQLQR